MAKGRILNEQATGIISCPVCQGEGKTVRRIPPFSHVEIVNTGHTPGQIFSEGFVAKGVEENWIAIQGRTLRLEAEPEALIYDILFTPGYYCCHCGLRLDNDAAANLEHVRAVHGGAPSPDRNNPHGYRKLNGYECILSDAQQERFRSVPLGTKRGA
jgi:hypothetical protein